MFSSIKIAMVIVVLATAGGGYLWIQKLQSDLETARANVARMEVAVATAEASIETMQKETARLGELNTTLQQDLQKAEKYGDELRSTLQRHNLTHLATQKPGLIEPRMQNATDELWKDLESITDPNANGGVQSTDSGTTDSNSN